MSDDQPTEPTVPLEPGFPSTEVETVGPEGASAGSRRVAVIAAVAVAVVAALGGGAYAAYSLLKGGGPEPDAVLPASTVAVVSVDLDPSAGQKIAAIKSIRRFPALKKSLGLHADDDLRQYVFDKIAETGDCNNLDFDKDVKPWLGKRAAMAAVDLGESHPTPVIALQVSDPGAAKKGFDAIVKCTDPEDFAFVVGDDYLIGSDTAAHAQAVLDKSEQKSLADDPAYQKWTDEAGDAGVLNFYVAKSAATYGADQLDQLSREFAGGIGGTTSEDPFGSVKDALKNFQGLGGTLRFAGGGMELSVAGGGLSQLSDLTTVGNEVGDLPDDTAVALGFGVSKDYAQKMVDQMGSQGDDFVAQAEDQTGLDLPGDLQTLLGHAVTLSLGGDAPKSLDDVQAVDEVPAGLVIHGDADKIKAIIAKAEDHLDMRLSDIPLVIEGSGDKVVLATSRDYAADLLKPGTLGSDADFRDAVPHAGDADGILWVDFDSAWRESLVGTARSEDGDGAAEDADANTKPLRSLGLSSWKDGSVSHVLLKITTD
jgi:hypothetical protein